MNAKETALVQNYAQSFVNKVNDREDVWSIYDEVAALLSIVKESDLHTTLESETVPATQKAEFVRSIRHSEYRVVNDLIESILQDGQVTLLVDVLQAILHKISQQKNEFEAHIASVYPLSDAQKERLCAIVEQRFSLKVRNVVEELDQSLLGGFVISVNHRIIDASVRTQLREIKSKL